MEKIMERGTLSIFVFFKDFWVFLIHMNKAYPF
jgi:hypothetical protein